MYVVLCWEECQEFKELETLLMGVANLQGKGEMVLPRNLAKLNYNVTVQVVLPLHGS